MQFYQFLPNLSRKTIYKHCGTNIFQNYLMFSVGDYAAQLHFQSWFASANFYTLQIETRIRIALPWIKKQKLLLLNWCHLKAIKFCSNYPSPIVSNDCCFNVPYKLGPTERLLFLSSTFHLGILTLLSGLNSYAFIEVRIKTFLEFKFSYSRLVILRERGKGLLMWESIQYTETEEYNLEPPFYHKCVKRKVKHSHHKDKSLVYVILVLKRSFPRGG